MPEQRNQPHRLTLGSALLLWVASWLLTGLVWGPPIGPLWIAPLPYALQVLAQLLPLVVTLGATLALMALLAARSPGRKTLLWMGIVSFAALIAAGILLPPHWRLLLQGPLLLLFGIALGFGLSRGFQQPEWIIPVLVILVFVDVYSVLLGPTKAVLESDRGAKAAEYVMVTLPSGHPDRPLGVQPFFGFPDALVMALLLGLSVRFAMPMGVTALAVVAGLLVAICLAGLSGQGIPALPYICGAYWIAHISRLRVDRESARQLLGFLATMVVLILVLRLLL